jgi:queuine tRNA-ribosyltransferase catalytic subunit
MKDIRQAITEDKFPEFIKKFMKDSFGEKENYPKWAVASFKKVNVDL